MSPRTLNVLRLVLTVLTLAMLGWYLHSRPRMDLAEFDLRWDRLALAGLCMFPLLWLRASKWRLLLLTRAPDSTLGQALRSYLGSMALALVTPGRVGELSRGLYLPHKAVQGWKGAALVLLDSWLDFLAVVFWAVLGFASLWGPRGMAWGLVLAAVLAPVPLWLRLGPPVLSLLPSRFGFRDWAARCLPAPGDVSGRNLVAAGLLGLLAYGLEWLQILLLLQAFIPLEAEFWRVAGVMAVVALANTVQVTLAGLGVREGLAMALLATLGIGEEPALMAAFLQSALILFLPAFAGLAVKPAAMARVS
jgi:uncharacterized membrane protein YbhN (UPF0104 family)